MWRNPLFDARRAAALVSPAAILLAAAGLLPAQSAISTIRISSPQSVLVCGRGLQLTAQAFDRYGGSIAGFVPQWQSANTAVATVDPAGNLRGLFPGLATIQAIDPVSGVRSSYVLRVEPLRISITPARPVLHAGDSARLAATALDAAGQPLAGVPFIWTSGVTDIATVAGDGTVSALKSGTVTISAAIAGVAGLNFSAGVPLNVLRKPDYQLTALISSDTATPAPTLTRPTLISASGDTFLAAIGDLSNGAQGLILTSHGVPQLLGDSGQLLTGTSRTINRFSGVSVNSAGDVVATVLFPSGCDSALVFYHQGQPPSVLDTGCGISITDRALANNGDAIYFLENNGNHFYIHHADGTRTLVVQRADTIGGSVVGSLGRAMLTANGSAAILEIYPAGSSGQLWFWSGSTFQQMAAAGGFVSVGAVTGYDFPVESGTGEIYCRLTLTTGPAVVHYTGGTWKLVAQANTIVGNTQLWWFYQISPAGSDGSIAVMADSASGTSVFRLTTGNPDLLASVQSWTNVTQLVGGGSGVIDSGLISGKPAVYLLASGKSPSALLSPGWQVPTPGSVSLLWDNVPERGSATSPLMHQPGDQLARLSGGAWQPAVGIGASAGGDVVNWLGPVVTSPDGKNAVFSANTTGSNGFLNAHDGRVDLIGDITNHPMLTGGQKISWIDPNWSGPYAMNANQFVALVNVGSQSSLMRFDLAAAQIAPIITLQQPSPAGAAYNWVNSAAIDASGDVAFYGGLTDGSSALFLWKNGQVQKLLRTGDTSLQGGQVSGISNTVWFAGSKVVNLVWYQNTGSQIQLFDGTSWTSVAASGTVLGSGRSIDYILGSNVAANDTGDIAYTAQTQGYAALLVRTHDGRNLVVASADQPLPDGSWPIAFFGFNLTPQGNVIFVAQTYGNGTSRLTLYSAAPTP